MMVEERFLVTGALGCIGAWTVKRLVEEGVPVWTYDLAGDPHRLRLVMNDAALARVTMLEGDITDEAAVRRAIADHRISHIIHLAALQVPFVRANPVLGARVNVVGTAIVFEAVRQAGELVRGLTYASSIGVYGLAETYPAGPLAHDAPHRPPALYGVTKQANEGWAKLYWDDFRVRSVGLRPAYVYGPGRDQGMTSTPTKAMVAAAAGRPYEISFGGPALMQHAEDVAAVFIKAARSGYDGAPVFNLGGNVTTIGEVVAAIEQAAPEAAGQITVKSAPLPYPALYDDSALNEALGPILWRPLTEGVRQTIGHFRTAAGLGRIDLERAMA